MHCFVETWSSTIKCNQENSEAGTSESMLLKLKGKKPIYYQLDKQGSEEHREAKEWHVQEWFRDGCRGRGGTIRMDVEVHSLETIASPS